jgi:beta-galactosidase GanA
MNVSWITHKNKKILYVDYRELNEEEMLKQLDYESELIMQQPEPILYLGDFTNTIATTNFMNKANDWGKKTEKNTARSAVLGINGMKSVLLNMYNLFTGARMRSFNNMEEAKEYLVKP